VAAGAAGRWVGLPSLSDSSEGLARIPDDFIGSDWVQGKVSLSWLV